MMNHDQQHIEAHEKAIAEMTAERYLLNELNDADAEAFERHYFDCRICADTVRAGLTMFAAGRELVEEKPAAPVPQPLPAPLPFRKRLSQWVPAAAAAALASVVTLQVARPPAPPMLQIATPSGGVITSVTRASQSDLPIRFEEQRPVEIVITPSPSDLKYPQYRVEIRDTAGKVLEAVPVEPGQAGHEDGLVVLLSPLPAGRYLVALMGVREDGNHPDIAKRHVVVQ